MISNRKEVDNCIHEVCEPIPSECTFKKNNEELSGNQENKEKENETESSKYKNEKANKVKNKTNLVVDEQPDAINNLKESYDKDDIDPHEKKRLCV